MILVGLWLLAQAGGATVGDTIWLSRTVAVPADRTLRASDWHPDDPVELLGPPRITARGDSSDIAYPVVAWRAGLQVVEVPGPLLLMAGGGVDSLPPKRFALEITSVLPRVPPDSGLAPQPRADFVPRTTVTIIPLLVMLALVAILLAPLRWLWRRRGPVTPAKTSPSSARPEPPIERWADAGEVRAVAGTTTARLRAAIASRAPAAHRGLDTESLLAQLAADRPDWPLADVGSLLRSLDAARFGAGADVNVVGLARSAAALEPRLAGGGG